MQRFHFHLIEGDVVLADNECCDLPGSAEAIAKATRQISEIVGLKLRESGIVRLDRAIGVASDDGAFTHRVDFAEAIRISVTPENPRSEQMLWKRNLLQINDQSSEIN